jgi:hypothetical protein
MLCPANILGYLFAICLLLTGAPDVECSKVSHPSPKAGLLNAPSFRAERPALLPLREAPGHAAEGSLFDFTGGNISKPGESHVECGSSLPPFAVRACPDVLPEFS